MGISRGCPKFLSTPQLYQERVKLWTSNLAVKFTVSIRTISHSKLWRKGSVGVSRDSLKLVRDLRTTSVLYAYLGIILCALLQASQVPRVSGGMLRSDGSFEYQFLINNTVYRYFKFTLLAMLIISAMPVFCLCFLRATHVTANFKFCTHSHGIDWNKSPLKMAGKLAVGVAMQELPKIFRAPIQAIGRIVRSSLRQHGFLVVQVGGPGHLSPSFNPPFFPSLSWTPQGVWAQSAHPLPNILMPFIQSNILMKFALMFNALQQSACRFRQN